ncbi:MAG: adenylosuccinate lyase [Chlamydiae bacterium]|nr:adenylosuccinate lyase [Chlamydiota bacterium]
MEKNSVYACYVSAFSTRYASDEMSWVFSEEFRARAFRRLWVALAEAERELGLEISESQIEAMKGGVERVDFEKVRDYERQFRHDVMAHIHAFGDVCPEAKGIIHWGATSSFVGDNGDLIQMKEGMRLLSGKMRGLMARLGEFAEKYADTATLSFTHYQPAQPTTIGKRACLWLQDFYWDALEWERLERQLPFLGAKGATGTQASFLALFEGDEGKVERLEKLIAKQFGFENILPIASQTYPRKIDLFLLGSLEAFAASAHKMATDIRLLAHDGEFSEVFGESQVGSSAMPHKRNPIYAERICGLARFVISLAQNPAYTAATQWLERSLDDSSNRRFCISEAFLGADALLNLLNHLLDHLEVDVQTAQQHLLKETPFLAMEPVLMAAVKKGKDRQDAHEILRQLAHECRKQKDPLAFFKGKIKELFDLSEKEINQCLDPKQMIGRAPSQVQTFLREVREFLGSAKRKKASFPRVEI